MFLMKAENTVTAATSRIICARGERDMRRGEAHRDVDRARAGDGGADEEGARDDDDDVVAEALEGLLRRHDAGKDRGEQRQRRDEVVAQPPPDEEAHHGAENAEGEALLEGHRGQRDEGGRDSNGREALRFPKR